MTIDRNCLDAETVAAWMDGGLDAAGVAAAEAHASTCERCQALLATVVKTLPADQLQQPSVVSGFSRIDKSRLWKWWFAPLAATAAAVTIWMVVPQTPMQTPAQPPAAPASAAARKQSGELRRDKPAEPGAQAVPPAPPPPPATVSNSRRNVPAPAASEGKATLAAEADAAKADEQRLGRKDASAAAREQSTELQQGKREENAERMREASPSVGAVTQLRKQTGPLQIVSPDPNSRWRAAPGTVERSEDGGRIWIPVRILANEEVLAGASPAPLVAWLVGRNGLVLLATDGTNFTRLPFPESVDLVAVTSPETRIALVTAADGRTFRTDDAGRSWRRQ